MITEAEASNEKVRCPKCGRLVESLRCGHCGSHLPAWQADLYGAAIRQIAKLGGVRADAGHQGGDQDQCGQKASGADELQGNGDKDFGGASTPQWLFDCCNRMAIDLCGEPITLDVAAAAWNHKCERYYNEDQDGRNQPWDAKAVWLNCPYSEEIIDAFVRKAIAERDERGTTTFALLPDWGGYKYMDLCERHGRIHRIKGPVVFTRKDGTKFAMNSGFSRSVVKIVVFGPKNAEDEPRELATTPRPEDDVEKCEGDSLQNTETPPSLCQWIFERLIDAGVYPKIILDPGAGRGNLTRPFRPGAEVIEYELQHGTDFLAETANIVCDLTICNPPWSWAERWLEHIVKLVGRHTPLVFISPVLFFTGYKDGPVRKYLESDEAPTLNHITPLPRDTFVKVYSSGAILWFNLPNVRDVALVPSRYLLRTNEDWSAPTGSEIASPTSTHLVSL